MSNRSASSSSIGRKILGAFFHPDVAGGAGAIAAAGVVERDAEVQGDVENGLLFAVIFVGQFAVLELHRLAFGQERDLHRVFAGGSSVDVPAPCVFSSDIACSFNLSSPGDRGLWFRETFATGDTG